MPPVNYREYCSPERPCERFEDEFMLDDWRDAAKRGAHIMKFFHWAEPKCDFLEFSTMQEHAYIFACLSWYREDRHKGISTADLRYRAERRLWDLFFQGVEDPPEWPFPSPPPGEYLFHPRDHGYSSLYQQWRWDMYMRPEATEFTEDRRREMEARFVRNRQAAGALRDALDIELLTASMERITLVDAQLTARGKDKAEERRKWFWSVCAADCAGFFEPPNTAAFEIAVPRALVRDYLGVRNGAMIGYSRGMLIDSRLIFRFGNCVLFHKPMATVTVDFAPEAEANVRSSVDRDVLCRAWKVLVEWATHLYSGKPVPLSDCFLAAELGATFDPTTSVKPNMDFLAPLGEAFEGATRLNLSVVCRNFIKERNKAREEITRVLEANAQSSKLADDLKDWVDKADYGLLTRQHRILLAYIICRERYALRNPALPIAFYRKVNEE
ncbi:hypothetical protein JDV02_009915 [Purpureocillium takamizusanense]|uniref:Uncharacterized protein n=1 Tax=Purpureocillium takamizusanense TaxID=2060973 RepID=A0A9Q8QTG2_9HYPO|nr:uncharacterized protein JDV02_009915 [Purpureocillium takamizusanense]UNI24142.1 hypothetical protein JDV02_009915 [Purpureocillium takamizusanense]